MQSPAQPDDTTPYDRVEYKGGTIAQTHPTRLATVAALFGLQSAPANRCRVLELGCGDGSNLIPMAFHHPDSEFVGVDLAHTPISVGRDQLDRLKLRNIRLLQGDVTEACEHLGAFDYVIAHGLYSWVPDSVRPHILRVAAERLTGNGVAYVSYNALPGCRLRHLVRDLLGFRFGADAREPTQLEPMREFLRAFSRVEEWSDGKFLDVLKREIAFVQNLPDDVLYHDDLAADSKAFYLRQFVADAGAWGLQYLGEADIVERFTMAGLGEFDALVDAWSNNDWVAREQYFDFVKGRRFRQTLLCKDSHRLLRDFGTHTVERLDLRSRLRLDDANAALFDRSEVSFSAGNRGVKLDEPIAKTALALLEQHYPDSVAFEDLLGETTAWCRRAGLTLANGESRRALAHMLWTLVRGTLVELLREPQRIAARSGTLPRISPLVRDQIARGIPLAGALHDNFALKDDLAAEIALAMDGSHDRAALERLACERTGAQPAIAAQRIEQLLGFLGRHGAIAG